MLWNNVGAGLCARPSLPYALFFRNKPRQEGWAQRPTPTFPLRPRDQSGKFYFSLAVTVLIDRDGVIRATALKGEDPSEKTADLLKRIAKQTGSGQR